MLLNAKKPKGRLGAELIRHMNENHEGLAKWSVGHLEISKGDAVLDVGCGGGVNVRRFLEMTDNKVFGLDYSEVSVNESIKLYQSAIEKGRCEIIHGSVSDLPFEDNTLMLPLLLRPSTSGRTL